MMIVSIYVVLNAGVDLGLGVFRGVMNGVYVGIRAVWFMPYIGFVDWDCQVLGRLMAVDLRNGLVSCDGASVFVVGKRL